MPIALITNFTADVTTGSAPLTVTFTDLSSPVPTGWLWDFGDSNSSTQQNPIHIYTAPGVYTVSLTITSPSGYPVYTQPGYITVNPPPVIYGGPLSYRVAVQGGNIVFSSADTLQPVDVIVNGQVDITNVLNVGNNTLAGGTITTDFGQNLILTTGTGGNLVLNPTGSILLNNYIWPSGSVNSGEYLGASNVNTLEFYSFVLPIPSPQVGHPNPFSDNLTISDLNFYYPDAQPGQMAIGPTVFYQCVSSGDWRTSSGGGGGGSPGGANTQIQYNNSGVFAGSAGFTWTDATNTLSLGTTSIVPNITVPQGNINNSGGLNIIAGGSTVGNASPINITGGNAGASGGFGGTGADINITAGNGGSSSTGGAGGAITIRTGAAGSGTTSGVPGSGSLTIQTGTGYNTGSVLISSGDSSTSNSLNVPGTVTLRGGDVTNASAGNLNSVIIRGGNTVGSGTGGDVVISGGTSGTLSNSGNIIFNTSATERFRIKATGDWQLAGSSGTSGQVFTSNGPNTPPSWQAVSGSSGLTINTQASDYTLQVSDAYNTLVRITKATSANVTLPSDTTAAIPVGAAVLIGWNGTGPVTIVADIGVTVDTPSSYQISNQYGKVVAFKVASNHWEIDGNLVIP